MAYQPSSHDTSWPDYEFSETVLTDWNYMSTDFLKNCKEGPKMTAYEQSGIEVLSRERQGRSTDVREGAHIPLLVSLGKDKRGGWRDQLNIKARCRRRCCLRSKAALLILLWNLIIFTSLSTIFNPSFYIYSIDNISAFKAIRNRSFLFIPVLYGIFTFLLLFYPLAGCLADTRWGRHKMVVNSVYVIFMGFIVMVLCGGVSALFLLADPYSVATAVSIPFFSGTLVIVGSFVTFSANVIQFGLDQLHDASTDDSVLYIHWYVWTTYLGQSIVMICTSVLSARDSDDSLNMIVISFLVILLISTCVLGVTLCIHKRNQWLLIDSGSRNPYQLVYRVIKFATQHNNAVHRSAFTYCEDELPSRLDLGKEKYGGPFTTEQVEDVKAFLGILCVLLSLGPILMVDIAVSGIVTNSADHNLTYDGFDSLRFKLIKSGGLSSLMIAFLIPLYLSLLRPFLQNWIPGILKRIGLGMIIILFSALCTLSLDTYGHVKISKAVSCFAVYTNESYAYSFDIASDILIIQCCLNTVGYLLLYIAIFEFICAQSPHSMKGLLIGSHFAIKGVFQLFGITIVYLPFTQWKWQLRFPSCGFVYYLINVVIGFVGIVAYTCIARKYQYRQRDEPDNTYRYAEEYYANAQDESSYGYDNSLNIHTIN